MSKVHTYPITLNQSNLDDGFSANNVYRYRFNQGNLNLKNSSISFKNISLYYSWNNISEALGNNKFQIVYPSGVSLNIVDVVIPDGQYSITDINAYIQKILIDEGFYLIDSNGDYVYYIEVVANTTQNKFQINSYQVPNALPANYTNPANYVFPFYPDTTPQIVILSNDFRSILGFEAGTYPTNAVNNTNQSILSNFTPQITPITSVVLLCNLSKNFLSNPNTVLYSFSPESSFGSLLYEKANYKVNIPIQDGSYEDLEIRIVDNNYKDISINDPNVLITLLLEIHNGE